MVGEGICRCAYGQAHVQCSDARDLSAPLTWQRGAHSATHGVRMASSQCWLISTQIRASGATKGFGGAPAERGGYEEAAEKHD